MSELSLYRPTSYSRRKTHTVWVGQIGVGGDYPIRVQSMTTSDTKDTKSVVQEIEDLVNVGCEIVRVTVPTQADCDNLPNIKSELKKREIKVPLIADIHFTPSIAMKVVEYVDKVRINPGNFVDKKLFKVLEYSDLEYQKEIDRIREKFLPLVLKCKEYNVAMRIGTNHGSLSDRIMNRYGDTPQGMVESALEFLRVCEENNYRQVILSMKASNVQVMTEAYRLLADALDKLRWHYPFHLGVTEAGAGEEGRIKSAIGIGALLEDGIGDTIRVSLTEDSVHEVPVAYELVKKYNFLTSRPHDIMTSRPLALTTSQEVKKSRSREVEKSHPIRVWYPLDLNNFDQFKKEYDIYLKDRRGLDSPLEGIEVFPHPSLHHFLSYLDSVHSKGGFRQKPALALCIKNPHDFPSDLSQFDKVVFECDEDDSKWSSIVQNIPSKTFIEWRLRDLNWIEPYSRLTKKAIYSILSSQPVSAYRLLAQKLASLNQRAFIHLYHPHSGGIAPLISHSLSLGSLLLDGIGQSIQFNGSIPLQDYLKIAYNILQGCRLRMTKTEYISCPSCGRTLFDLQTTTQKIREATSHLKGVKIGVMGCIVNGPGEMADADFGYVGTGQGKISLYVGKECVQRNIPEDQALTSLVGLIKEHNRWVEPLVEPN